MSCEMCVPFQAFAHLKGRLAIYELMAEESVINYWEKYGNIAFDNGQKAVLTSCLLKNPDTANSPNSQGGKGGVINCCFSFTIRRDKYNMYRPRFFCTHV